MIEGGIRVKGVERRKVLPPADKLVVQFNYVRVMPGRVHVLEEVGYMAHYDGELMPNDEESRAGRLCEWEGLECLSIERPFLHVSRWAGRGIAVVNSHRASQY